jgi:lipoate-protein ligase A
MGAVAHLAVERAGKLLHSARDAMRFLNLTLPTPAENLALDEALLAHAEEPAGGEVLRVWESRSLFVVLGYFCKLADDVDEAACRAGGVPILRRTSGGGTVLQGPGCLNYALVLDMRQTPALHDIGKSNRIILDRVARALAPKCPGVAHHPPSDLALGGLKFSGNAQRRRRNWLLHHGTLLYGFPLDLISRHLREPSRQPDYRARRPHADFVTNLGVERAWLIERLRAVWRADEPAESWPQVMTQELATTKYSSDEWTRRR